MKIYVQDRGVYGCIVVLAENREQAIEIMKTCESSWCDNEEHEIEELDITAPCVVIDNWEIGSTR